MIGWILQKNYPGKIISYETIKLIESAKKKGILLLLIDPWEFEIIITENKKKRILLNYNIIEIPDFILPRLGSSISYFALTLIKHCEKLGVYCCNDSASIELVKDKLLQIQFLSNYNFRVPKTILAKFPINIQWIGDEIKYPLLVKLLTGSRGRGVFLCENQNIFEDLIRILEISSNRQLNFIIQEFISTSSGRDLRIFIVGDKILGGIERKSLDKSFKSNFSRGGLTQYYSISKELKNEILKIMKLFNLKIAGIDLLFDKDKFKICEINSSPGFKGFELVNKVDVSVEILNYIVDQIAIRKKMF